jgi:hypothetical protein
MKKRYIMAIGSDGIIVETGRACRERWVVEFLKMFPNRHGQGQPLAVLADGGLPTYQLPHEFSPDADGVGKFFDWLSEEEGSGLMTPRRAGMELSEADWSYSPD